MRFEQIVLYIIESKVVIGGGFIPLIYIFTSCAFYIVAVVQETEPEHVFGTGWRTEEPWFDPWQGQEIFLSSK